MQIATQYTVSSVNKPGRLHSVLEALRKGKVELAAMSVMDSMGRGVLRFVTDDTQAASAALEGIGVGSDTHDVLLVDLPNQNGAMPHLCERLAAGHLETDYAYVATKTGKGSHLLAVVKVNDLTKAQRVLSETASNGAPKKMPRRRPMHAR